MSRLKPGETRLGPDLPIPVSDASPFVAFSNNGQIIAVERADETPGDPTGRLLALIEPANRWAALMATPPAQRRCLDILAALDLDEALTLRMHRPHWTLADPVLNHIYVTERPEGGRHRGGDYREYRAGMWFMWEERDVPTGPPQGRHACTCDQCIDEVPQALLEAAALQAALDETGWL